MEAVYRQKDGSRLMLFDEGNRLQAVITGSPRGVRIGILCEDYYAGATTCKADGEVYIAYLSTEQKLIFERIYAEGRMVLAAGEAWGVITDIRIAQLAGEKPRLFVLYRYRDEKNGQDRLYAVDVLEERKVRTLLQTNERIERYEIIQKDGMSYLLYRLTGEPKTRIYAVDVSRLGDINLTEYILCKEQTMQELAIRCKENDKNFQAEIKKKQTEYEKRLKETAESIEKSYKTQYEELAKLTKGMQEEGRKWRELYYKSVTKS